MARSENAKASLRPFKSTARPDEKWVVYWPNDVPGKARKYRRFESKKAADAFLLEKEIEILNQGRESAATTDRTLADATWAARELKPFGVSLRDVVALYLSQRQLNERSAKLCDAIPDFLEAKAKAGRSARYIGDLRAKLNRLGADYGERLVSEITSANLDSWLEGLKVAAVTRNGFRRVLIVFFEWSRRKGYCDDNAARLTEAATVKGKRVEIFTPAEIRVILNAAPPELVPVIALGAFAGLRPEEIRRLDWRQVNLLRGRIEIDAETSKTASHRYVPINATLRQWIEPSAKAAGPVAPINFYRRLWMFHNTLAKADKKNGRPAVEWKNNGLRHSFASYSLAAEQDAARVALWLGHTSPTMTFKHYRERVEGEAAEDWFAVIPEDAGGTVEKIA